MSAGVGWRSIYGQLRLATYFNSKRGAGKMVSGRSLKAAFVATAVLSLLMFAKGMMGLMPELNVIKMLGGMAHEMMGVGGPAVGWALHFIIGVLIFGTLFEKLNDKLPGGSQTMKGIAFGVAAWLVMMVAVMPMVGAGMFGKGLGIGMVAPVMTLMLHLIYGAVLGIFYAKFEDSAALDSPADPE
jgi:Family of unknown function (DUF6789)